MKYFASDVDGTLIRRYHPNAEREILSDDIQILQNWVNQNYLIISTGRTQISLFNLFDYYHIYTPNTFYVTSNGAEIYDSDRKRIYQKKISGDILKRVFSLIQTLNDSDMKITVFSGHELNILTKNEFSNLNNITQAVSICLESISENQNRANQWYDILTKWCDEYEVHINNWYVDIVPPKISKADSILWLISVFLKDSSYRLASIGDGINDICMFEISQMSYTFPSSNDKVKESAKEIVSYVYEAVEKELSE